MTAKEIEDVALFSNETDIDDIDLDDLNVGAHVIYGSLSSIDAVNTTPEIFWRLFGTKNGKAGTMKWLNSAIDKLVAIKSSPFYSGG